MSSLHAEETTGSHLGPLHGVQLWVAQPSTIRDGAAAFEHHPELPQVELDGGIATVLIGELAGARSPARRDTDHVGSTSRPVAPPSRSAGTGSTRW